MSIKINPQKLYGKWIDGWALDFHTVSSKPIGVNNYGRTIWDTKRPPIAEELYRFKYCNERYRVDGIAKIAAWFLNKFKSEWQLDVIIPIPPSESIRIYQPVYEIAKFVGQLVELPVNFNILKKVKSTSQIKDIEEPDTRREILKDAFSVDCNALCDKNVLIFDDLYRSGITLNTACDVIMNIGKARKVYVLTITKTRTKK